MADFSFFMPTRIIYGAGSIKAEAESLVLGKKALIVTGRKSAKASGALDDVLAALSTDYVIFDQVENNPRVDTTVRGGKLARDSGCDFVIAIGGGSPLDAAKAIAVLAVNDVEPLTLYTDGWSNKALPIAAVPTTAGTGSEVTQYAVLTIDEEETKKGLRGPDLFPTKAFLDPKYTQSLPLDVTVDTAVDALSHLVEGYLSNRASPMSCSRGVKDMGSVQNSARTRKSYGFCARALAFGVMLRRNYNCPNWDYISPRTGVSPHLFLPCTTWTGQWIANGTVSPIYTQGRA